MNGFERFRKGGNGKPRNRIHRGIAGLFAATFLSAQPFATTEEPSTQKVLRRGLLIADVVEGVELSEHNDLTANHSQVVSQFPFQEGWPVTVDGLIDANPAVGDIDGDGDLEVVFSLFFDNFVGAFHHDGSLVNGWPQPYGGRSAAFADLEGDGTLEIFFGSGRWMRGFHHDGTLISGWPRESPGAVFLAVPSINDLDLDGDQEIASGTSTGPMHVWDDSGENHPGWPKDLPGPVLSVIRATASVGNLDSDPQLEILVGSQQRKLFAWDHNAADLPGFPISMGARLNGEAALADFDGDGELEIAFGTDLNDSDRIARVYVLNPDGSILPGWPQEVISTINGGIAAGDLNEDGSPEVVAATSNTGGQVHGKVWVWNGENASLLPGWPQIATFTAFDASPAIGDLSGDGKPDVLAVGLDVINFRDTIVWAWQFDGTLVEGFPFRIEGFLNFLSSPTITDLDGDGDVEIGFGTEPPLFGASLPAKMFFFDLPAPYDPSTMEWPTLSHDIQRTGRYSPPPKRQIPLIVDLPNWFLNLDHPQEVLVTNLSFEEKPSGPFAIAAIDGGDIDPIEAIGEVMPPGRPGWGLVRFDGRELAEAILQVRPDASEVEITIKAPINNRTELVGSETLAIRSNHSNP